MSTKKEKEFMTTSSIRTIIDVSSKMMTDKLHPTISNLCPELPDMVISQLTELIRQSFLKGASCAHIAFALLARDFIECSIIMDSKSKDVMMKDFDRIIEWDKVKEDVNDASDK